MTNKSVLIIDTPKRCIDCVFFSKNDDWKCNIHNEVIFRCPLIPLEDGTLKYGNKEYIIYERNFLYKNLESEIEIMREGKKFYESNISN